MHAKQIEHFYPLSPMQQGMLFHTLYAPGSGVYFEQITCVIRGDIDESAFQRAWQTVVDRHPILRTVFVWEDLDEPVQVVRRDVYVPLARHDWRGLASDQQRARLAAYLQGERDQGFDLTVAPLLRLALFRVEERTYQLAWSFHHLLLDGWSIPLILEDVFACYEALCQGREAQLAARRPYRDYIVWLRQRDPGPAEAFWRRTLEGFAAPTPLGVDLPAGDGTGAEGRHVEQHLQLSAAATAALHAFVRQQQMTLNTLVQGAWALLLSRYSGETDVVFGATVSGRPPDLVGSEAMVGLFINTLPVRVQVTPGDALLPWLKRLHAQQVELRQYEYSQLVQIQRWSAVPRRLPMFESILVFENYPVDAALQGRGGSLAIQDVRSVEQSNYPLTVVAAQGTMLTLRIGYDRRRFEAATIARMLGHLQAVLEEMVANPRRRLAEIPILTAAERRQLLVEWNATQADAPRDACAHDLIDAHARRTPDAVAVVFDRPPPGDKETRRQGDKEIRRQGGLLSLSPQSSVLSPECLTYGELSRRTNQLARHLRSLGVGPEVRVAICVERSVDLVVGVLGILKAGGAYVPIDPAYPPEHLAFMLEDAQARVLLTTKRLGARDLGLEVREKDPRPKPQAPSPTPIVVCLDTDREIIARASADPLPGYAQPDHLAYVIYTSGSTGRPKGVMISHRAMLNLTFAFCDALELRPDDQFLMVPSLSFDASVGDIFPSLLGGGALVLHPAPAELAGQDLLRLCERQRIAILDIPAAFWAQWVHDLAASRSAGVLAALKLIIVGGESISTDRLRAWMDLTARRAAFFGPYGPTEATVCTTFYKLPAGAEPPAGMPKLPIGRPIAGAQVYLLDRHMQPVPVGVAGELYIGGAGLARGYHERPDLTAERFIPNPFGDQGSGIGDQESGAFNTPPTPDPRPPTPGTRLYQTGDLARYLPDGNIEFLGRVDQQVKVRGYRIELGEIEATLRRHPAVRESAVVVREDVPGDKRLVAYVVPRDWRLEIGDSHSSNLQSPISNLHSGLRKFLKERLPDHMVPGAFVTLEAMPISSNGKIDRRALPTPEGLRPELETEYEAPRDETEQTIAAVWQTVLRVDRVGVHDNFFDLGGHSLLMIQAHGKLREALRRDLSLIELFKYPSVNALARFVSQEQSEAPSFGQDNLADKLKEGKNRLKQQLQQKQRGGERVKEQK